MVFTVLIRSITQFIDAPFRFAQVLLGIARSAALSINFRFKLTDPSLHLIHGFLTSLQSIGLSFIQTSLHVLDLTFIQFAIPLKYLSKFLFSSEFISQSGSINHGLLSF